MNGLSSILLYPLALNTWPLDRLEKQFISIHIAFEFHPPNHRLWHAAPDDNRANSQSHKSNMSTLLSTAVRSTLKVVGVLAIFAGLAWATRTHLVADDIKTDASQISPQVRIPTYTTIRELPRLTSLPPPRRGGT